MGPDEDKVAKELEDGLRGNQGANIVEKNE